MSAQTNTIDLYQQNMQQYLIIIRNYDKHRLQLNRIKTKSSPVFKKKSEQDSIMGNRNSYQLYNSRFRHKGIHDKIFRKFKRNSEKEQSDYL